MFTHKFLSIYQAKLVINPFSTKSYVLLIHYNINGNIDDGLNFVTCEQGLNFEANMDVDTNTNVTCE